MKPLHCILTAFVLHCAKFVSSLPVLDWNNLPTDIHVGGFSEHFAQTPDVSPILHFNLREANFKNNEVAPLDIIEGCELHEKYDPEQLAGNDFEAEIEVNGDGKDSLDQPIIFVGSDEYSTFDQFSQPDTQILFDEYPGSEAMVTKNSLTSGATSQPTLTKVFFDNPSSEGIEVEDIGSSTAEQFTTTTSVPSLEFQSLYSGPKSKKTQCPKGQYKSFMGICRHKSKKLLNTFG